MAEAHSEMFLQYAEISLAIQNGRFTARSLSHFISYPQAPWPAVGRQMRLLEIDQNLPIFLLVALLTALPFTCIFDRWISGLK